MRMIIIYKSKLAARVSVRDDHEAATDRDDAMPPAVARGARLSHSLQPGQFNSLNNDLTDQ
ncbi:hypothetical protein [Burkholderia arboris]|uniref:Prevent-host-death protein n=1 Tax=Burkholderia arboris TaxID=488730 RepID=A0ABZ3DJZ0_9BURK|nr:hypothetical protein [Burkholderia arboris]MCA8493142.1 hypothetical protein [Burkholderia arboris]UTV56134.1 hypothetical protein NLX30_07085 [Burkholderia arboris]